MPFKITPPAKCPKCGQSVYAAEERLAGGHKFHKGCFRCEMCDKSLDSTNVTEHGAKLFCKQCHGRKFGPKGYGFGQGAGALSMDQGEAFGNNQSEMSNVPQGNNLGPAAGGVGGGNRCGRCNKAVYHAEKAIGVSMPWHKMCLKCGDCAKSLDSTNLAIHSNEIYCKGCYAKHYGPKGYGFGGGAGTLSMCQ